MAFIKGFTELEEVKQVGIALRILSGEAPFFNGSVSWISKEEDGSYSLISGWDWNLLCAQKSLISLRYDMYGKLWWDHDVSF